MQSLYPTLNHISRVIDGDAPHRIHDTWRCNADIIRICDLSPKHPSICVILGNTGAYIDHYKTFQTKDRQLFIFDDPYIPSKYIDPKYENELIHNGFRILYLPKHMSRYVVGKCQPRLIAPPKSKVNLQLIAHKLALGKFKGNTLITYKFRNTPYPVNVDVESVFQQAISDPNFGNDFYIKLRGSEYELDL
jgi:spore maturation protein CgeB